MANQTEWRRELDKKETSAEVFRAEASFEFLNRQFLHLCTSNNIAARKILSIFIKNCGIKAMKSPSTNLASRESGGVSPGESGRAENLTNQVQCGCFLNNYINITSAHAWDGDRNFQIVFQLTACIILDGWIF
jgi:hypothetical protein